MLRVFLLLIAVSLESDAQIPIYTNNGPLFVNPVTVPEAPDSLRFETFDLELFREVAKSKSNVLISPASTKSTLGMLLAGARGKTADEISKYTGIPKDAYGIDEKQIPLWQSLSGITNGTTVRSKSGVFVSDKHSLFREYISRVHQYGAVYNLSFANPTAIAKTINRWVSNQTHGLIDNLVSPAHFVDETAAVIVNALYFRGLWRKAFDPQRTGVRCFKTPTKECSKVQMMQNIETYNYKYLAELDAQVIELPYNDDVYAMYVILPRTKKDIDVLLQNLMYLSQVFSDLKETEVMLDFPKFSFEYEIDLAPELQKMGIRDLFNPRANLSGIVMDARLHVSSLVHKTKIEVDERGTVAAAATGAIVIPLMGSTRPRVVVDHPFAFIIYNKRHKTVLFEGVVNEPNEVVEARQRSQFDEYHQYTQQQIFEQ